MTPTTIILSIKNKLPRENNLALLEVDESLQKLNETQLDSVARKIAHANFKDPTIVFWIGSFLLGNLGIGRFMIGDYLLGCIRLSLVILINIISNFTQGEDTQSIMLNFSLVLFLSVVMFVWWVIDLFIVGKKLRKENLQKLTQIISQAK